ncbi:terpene cyclase/mutase family protein [Gemmata sp. G18]|uniref:Terpene cyclase/mutase family protein n=1 Tax=Gemmata palustris TaxID=2822762 RepID=A0ABS5BYK3_9BACT|nr:prenyltransferase/squalene oxidase repeat-containing protein [Gemmata palustris]MBP3958740.1 terpene cyclase/mutase family protein [Gemmata palustris]
MSEKPNAPVIRRLGASEESSQERLVKKHVPAWVASGGIHVAVIFLAILVLGNRQAETKNSETVVNTTAETAEEQEDKNLSNDDLGIDSNVQAALPEIDRIDQKTIDLAVTQDNVGQPNVDRDNTNAITPAGIGAEFTAGTSGDTGAYLTGNSGGNAVMSQMVSGRSGATKARLIKEGGGNAASERAVASGLAWLVKQQMTDGGWKYDQGRTEERAAATGMALLPFLAAGVTHKKKEDKDFKGYERVVSKGLDFLKGLCAVSGTNAGRMSTDVYAQAIATLPLCEAYGMTKDPGLRPFAQAAINYIQKTQAANGSWGYGNTGPGDTSIVGWQVQALKAAKLSKDLVVDDRVIQKANKFLDFAAAGTRKSMYGYANNADAKPGTALTAVGLLCRYYVSDWGPVHPGMIDGVGGLMKTPPIGSKEIKDMYYYYYATQVVHFFEGEEWKTWNEGPKQADGTRKGGMRDWLLGQQSKKELNTGSWDPESGWFGSQCGRLGTTAMCLLTLEVYYRHLPLYKRGADGQAIQIIE